MSGKAEGRWPATRLVRSSDGLLRPDVLSFYLSIPLLCVTCSWFYYHSLSSSPASFFSSHHLRVCVCERDSVAVCCACLLTESLLRRTTPLYSVLGLPLPPSVSLSVRTFDSLFFLLLVFFYCWHVEEGMHSNADGERNNSNH